MSWLTCACIIYSAISFHKLWHYIKPTRMYTCRPATCTELKLSNNIRGEGRRVEPIRLTKLTNIVMHLGLNSFILGQLFIKFSSPCTVPHIRPLLGEAPSSSCPWWKVAGTASQCQREWPLKRWSEPLLRTRQPAVSLPGLGGTSNDVPTVVTNNIFWVERREEK